MLIALLTTFTALSAEPVSNPELRALKLEEKSSVASQANCRGRLTSGWWTGWVPQPNGEQTYLIFRLFQSGEYAFLRGEMNNYGLYNEIVRSGSAYTWNATANSVAFSRHGYDMALESCNLVMNIPEHSIVSEVEFTLETGARPSEWSDRFERDIQMALSRN